MSDRQYIPVNKQMLDVINFNSSILGVERRKPGPQSVDEFKLSMHQLKEEISEIEKAFETGDFIGILDGLIDLEYFLLGIFYKNGINESIHHDLFDAVHQANLLKKVGTKAGREGYNAADAIKPDSWINPELKFARILDKVNQRGS
jgi:predicted HAD superfamily Cof-like phosphohydrolase